MNSVTDATRFAEKRHRDKQNKEEYKIYNNQLQKTKKTTELEMNQQYELKKKKV